MNILVTGVAGFIGYHLTNKLLSKNLTIHGIDSLSSYYDVDLKNSRLKNLKNRNFKFYHFNLKSKNKLFSFFNRNKIDLVIHLAAQAGVRYSISNPYTYISNNISSFLNILECCRQFNVKHLIYASSSSVYGNQYSVPYSESQKVDTPLNLYASTKKTNESMAYAYSSLYKIPTTGLRFFTVYGPYGRPDMALFKFVKNILNGLPIKVFNHGNMVRDFTYIDDIVEAIYKLIDKIPGEKKYNKIFKSDGLDLVPAKVFNLGNNNPVKLNYFISVIEKNLK